MVKPPNTASIYYKTINYKNNFSIALIVVAKYKFIYVDAGAYSKSNDSVDFEATVLYKKV
nr:unnamed protein product [Callosobruchus analis]